MPNDPKGFTEADLAAVESPELTDEQLAQGKPFAEAFPALAAKAGRGRPFAEAPKVAVSMRLDADLAEALRASGRGWQSRANAMLRKAVGL